jgi:type IV pilus assembly protein PilY1
LTLQTKNLVGNSGDTFEDWTITCLEGSSASGSISSGSEELTNAESTSATITTASGDFSGCERAMFASYNLVGTEDESYLSWEVTNFDNSETDGTSSSTITLANDGTLTFVVSPTTDWVEVGDRIQVASYTTTTVDLDDVSYLWNAREELYLSDLDDDDLSVNRDYTTDKADEGRYITTWVDYDLDGVVDENEYRDFDTTIFDDSSVSYSYFDVSSETEARNLVEYIRGIEKDDSRNRTIQYSSDDSESHVMRLGDIVNSTPTAVTSPAEAFDLLYYDTSYSVFKAQYIDRRNVIYAGANDGMIHAFNGGFYTETTDDDGETVVSYSTSGTKHDGTPAVEHPLGSELWAYAPMNLLPHLQWLKDENYGDSHVNYMDSKPRVFEAKIFDTDDDHPEGWGQVMVVGMNLGGGAMAVDIEDANKTTESHTFRSAYVIMDITNPEVAPILLGEIQPPDESFTSVYPAVAAFQDVGDNTTCGSSDEACNSWYLIFGTGPDDLSTVESSQSTKVYLFNLRQLVDGEKAPTTAMSSNSSCTVDAYNDLYNIITCDTGIGNTFMGTPVVVDWDLDFKANTLYFGLVRDEDTSTYNSDNSDTGLVMRMAFKDDADHTYWDDPTTFFDAGQPLSIYDAPVPGIDDNDHHWIYFGTGRYFSSADKTTIDIQSLFGVKDDEDDIYPVENNDLLDVTDAEVYTDGTLQTDITGVSGSTLSTFDEIVDEIDSGYAAGWYRELPAISGTTGVDPATRNVTDSLLINGVLVSTVFQPSEDPCEGEGNSRLYGLYYKTGTGYPDSPILGTSTEEVDGTTKYLTTTYINLGTGFASAPTATSGSGSDTITVYTKLSTGATIATSVDDNEVSSGRTSWTDIDPDN